MVTLGEAQDAALNAIVDAQRAERISEGLHAADRAATDLLDHEPNSRPGLDCKFWWIPKISRAVVRGRREVHRIPLCFPLPNDDAYIRALGELLGPTFTVRRRQERNRVWVEVSW